MKQVKFLLLAVILFCAVMFAPVSNMQSIKDQNASPIGQVGQIISSEISQARAAQTHARHVANLDKFRNDPQVQALPFDISELMNPDWRQKIQASRGFTESLRSKRLSDNKLNGVIIADLLYLPARVEVTSDVLIIVNKLVFEGQDVLIKGNHNINIFNIDSSVTTKREDQNEGEITYRSSPESPEFAAEFFSKNVPVTGTITVDTSGYGRAEWMAGQKIKNGAPSPETLIIIDQSGTAGANGTAGLNGNPGNSGNSGSGGTTGSCPLQSTGGNGGSGANATGGAAGGSGTSGTAGTDGDDIDESIAASDTNFYVLRSNGADGGYGGVGGYGGAGGTGGNGGDGGNGVTCSCFVGAGGNGGWGGNGGNGGAAGNGGDGGDGGDAGDIMVSCFTSSHVSTQNHNGSGGSGGSAPSSGGLPGAGGLPGDGGNPGDPRCGNSNDAGGDGDSGGNGSGGSGGTSGAHGAAGLPGSVQRTEESTPGSGCTNYNWVIYYWNPLTNSYEYGGIVSYAGCF